MWCLKDGLWLLLVWLHWRYDLIYDRFRHWLLTGFRQVRCGGTFSRRFGVVIVSSSSCCSSIWFTETCFCLCILYRLLSSRRKLHSNALFLCFNLLYGRYVFFLDLLICVCILLCLWPCINVIVYFSLFFFIDCFCTGGFWVHGTYRWCFWCSTDAHCWWGWLIFLNKHGMLNGRVMPNQLFSGLTWLS